MRTKKRDDSKFKGLRGIGKETFRKLGGGEAFIKAERKAFYSRPLGKRRSKNI
jgi:hypothetical protein